MKAEIQTYAGSFQVDLSKPIDISIPLRNGKENVNAWNADPVRIEAVRIGDWIGEVNQGGSVNYRNIFFNPHGNGTHTECVGHISNENYTINQCLKEFFFIAKLISIDPEKLSNGDMVISLGQMRSELSEWKGEALIIRTLPNPVAKMTKNYSGTNPIYLEAEAAIFIREQEIQHLLIDLPSVDREQDGGKLSAHHAFWNYPSDTRENATITELIYVPDAIADGTYLLNIQIASFENDASPSKILLFPIQQ